MLRRIVLAAAACAVLGINAARADDSLLNPAFLFNVFPTTDATTLRCANFVKTSEGAWRAIRRDQFRLGFVQHIVPPGGAILIGGWIYNNVDLYSQLEHQCGQGVTFVRAKSEPR